MAVRTRIPHSTSNVAISLVVPFFAYIPAERLDASGLVAAVVAGLVTGHRAPKHLRPQDRITTEAVWRTLEMLLESLIFLLMGLELYGLIIEVHEEHGSVHAAVLLGVLCAVLVIMIRAAFVALSLWLLHRRGRRGPHTRKRIAAIQNQLDSGDLMRERSDDPRWQSEEFTQRVQDRSDQMSTRITRRLADLDYLSAQAFGWREGIVLVWAGMRGAVTLAAAQSLLADTPQRALLILIAFVVAAGTLLVQGGTLGWLVRLLGLTRRSPDVHQEQLFELRRELAQVITEHLDDGDLTKPDGMPFSPLAIDWARRIIATLVTADDQRGADGEDLRSERGQLRLALIQRQHAELLRIRDLGTYPSSVLEATMTQLDADQLSLELRTSA